MASSLSGQQASSFLTGLAATRVAASADRQSDGVMSRGVALPKIELPSERINPNGGCCEQQVYSRCPIGQTSENWCAITPGSELAVIVRTRNEHNSIRSFMRHYAERWRVSIGKPSLSMMAPTMVHLRRSAALLILTAEYVAFQRLNKSGSNIR
jgi:hypothetical protein